MSTVKTAISVEATLFEEVEQLAHELNVSRSRIFAMAMEQFLQPLRPGKTSCSRHAIP